MEGTLRLARRSGVRRDGVSGDHRLDFADHVVERGRYRRVGEADGMVATAIGGNLTCADGGLTQQGYPISEEFTEISPLDGKPYLVQYFERAVFEYHPENKAPYDVLLSQLGTLRYRDKYKVKP